MGECFWAFRSYGCIIFIHIPNKWGADLGADFIRNFPRFIMVDLYPKGAPTNMTGCLNADGLLDVTRCAEQIGIAPEESIFSGLLLFEKNDSDRSHRWRVFLACFMSQFSWRLASMISHAFWSWAAKNGTEWCFSNWRSWYSRKLIYWNEISKCQNWRFETLSAVRDVSVPFSACLNQRVLFFFSGWLCLPSGYLMV